MTLIVEDGSRVAGANTYISLASFKAWADDRNITYSSDNHVEAQILRAMDYIESLSFIGFKETSTQSLQWPRVNVVIDGFALNPFTLPVDLKVATYEAVKTVIDGDSKQDPIDRQVISESVDTISITYKDTASQNRQTPALTRALRKLVQSPNTVMRA
jgi:hypothetical protein